MILLGINCGHDAAACLIIDGAIVADVAEERFSRIKHDSGFPRMAIAYCLNEGGIDEGAIDVVALSGKSIPSSIDRHFLLTQEQRAELAAARPIGTKVHQLIASGRSQSLPLYVPPLALSPDCRLKCVSHHLSHAAAAHFTRGHRDRCLIVTMDGMGDDVSVAIWLGEDNDITPVASWGTEASLGWFYGTVTEALGWQHGDGEGTTMGLAPYGDPERIGDRLNRYHPTFADGVLQKPYDFGQASAWSDHGNYHFHFRDAEPISELAATFGAEHVAARTQDIIEQQVLGLIEHWLGALNVRRLACGGGLFLNVKLNQRIWYYGGLEEHWIHPNPGDAGLAAGAVLYAWHSLAKPDTTMKLEHLAYGPGFSDAKIRETLDARGLSYCEVDDPAGAAAHLLAANRTVGWFQGRMETGPRALGNRSILMSANLAANKETLNARVKFRESFRPFCPSILGEKMHDYLRQGREENFMMTAFDIVEEKRGRVPAVVHVDGTVRPQTVKRETNPLFHDLIKIFGDLTGEYLVLNTSFNIKGEPIVCNPREAIRCFYDTGLDALVMGRFVLTKTTADHSLFADRIRSNV